MAPGKVIHNLHPKSGMVQEPRAEGVRSLNDVMLPKNWTGG